MGTTSTYSIHQVTRCKLHLVSLCLAKLTTTSFELSTNRKLKQGTFVACVFSAGSPKPMRRIGLHCSKGKQRGNALALCRTLAAFFCLVGFFRGYVQDACGRRQCSHAGGRCEGARAANPQTLRGEKVVFFAGNMRGRDDGLRA